MLCAFWDLLLHPLQRLVASFEFVGKLFFAAVGEEGAQFGTRFQAERNQIIAGQQGRDDLGLVRQFLILLHHEFVMVEATVRTQTIKAVQLQFQRKGLAHQHATQCRFAHRLHVFELHVMQNGSRDFLGLLFGEFQPLQNSFRHLRADFFVAVEVNRTCLQITRGGDGFGDVMQQGGPGQ